MSFSSLKGFYVSEDLDVVLDSLVEDGEEICRIETCILMKSLDSKNLVGVSGGEVGNGRKAAKRGVRFKQRTFLHVILTSERLILTRMNKTNRENEACDSVVVPWNLVKSVKREQTLVSRTEAFRLFGCTPKGREQLYLLTFQIATGVQQTTEGEVTGHKSRKSGCGGNCFASYSGRRGKGESASDQQEDPTVDLLQLGIEEGEEEREAEKIETFELLTIEPDSHLYTTSSLIWTEKKIGRKALASFEQKKTKPSHVHHKHLHELPQLEVNTKFFHNLMTLLDSNRLINKADAVALKELVKTMYGVKLSDGTHFKRIFYASSKAWPVIVERLSAWLQFLFKPSSSVGTKFRIGDATDGFDDEVVGKVHTLEAQTYKWNGRMYSNSFRKLKEWPFASTNKETIPYHAERQKKWLDFVNKVASEHVAYKIRYLIHLIYYMTKDCAPIQERLYWLLGYTHQNEAGQQSDAIMIDQTSCFLDLFVLVVKCLLWKHFKVGKELEQEHEIVSILYYIMKFSEEAAESEDKDPLTFLSTGLSMLTGRELDNLVRVLLERGIVFAKSVSELTYEWYQSIYLASRIIKLRPNVVHSFSKQFEVDFKYHLHQLKAQLNDSNHYTTNFLNKIYIREYTNIYLVMFGLSKAI